MELLKSGPNICQLVDVVRDPATKTPALITEFINCPNPMKVWKEMNLEEL